LLHQLSEKFELRIALITQHTHTVADITDFPCEVGDIAKFELNPMIAGIMLPKRYI